VLTGNSRSDLQRQAHQIPNPFDEDLPRVQEYTAKEIAILQSRLEKQLGPEYISSRKGPGGQTVHYLGAEKIINLANEVFGFNGWSTSIRDTTIDYVDIDKDGRVSMGLSIIMRVTLRDGTYHEDVGYGIIANCPTKGAAFEKTKKEAATDAMKRALRNFGNVLGNCLYDKEYLKKVVKIKPPPSKWSEDNLHRHPDVVPRKPQPPPQYMPEVATESTTEKASSLPPTRMLSEQSKASVMSSDYDDEFGGNAFDDVDFTRSDEFVVPADANLLDAEMEEAPVVPKQEVANGAMRQAQQRANSLPQQRPSMPNTGQRPPIPPQPVMPPVQQRPNGQLGAGIPGQQPPPYAARSPHQHTEASAVQRPQVAPPQQRVSASTPEMQQNRQPIQQPQPNNGMPPGQPMPETPVGFVRGRVADLVQSANGQIPTNGIFNPHAESPSIRKTGGFNHRTSAPVRREDIGAPAAPAPPANNGPQGFVPPHINQNSHAQNTSPVPHANTIPGLQRTNFVSPQQDPHRRIGAPMGMQSPGGRPGGYKPPGPAGVKRGPPDTGPARAPLSDVSNVKQPTADAGASGGDPKRARIHGGQEGVTEPVVAS
jgi:DNA repair and recombination protein RAD52